MGLLSIQELNATSDDKFIRTVEALFEPAPPLAAALLKQRPFESWEQLLDVTDAVIASLSEVDRLVVINAHPRIGLELLKEQLSASSLKEQGYTNRASAVSNEDAEVNATLQKLNDEYEERFGFKFVVFVAGRPRSAIVDVIRERMNNSKQEELETGLKAMVLIARDRLKKQRAESASL
ncbi:Oxo-4-hydroxy-4-carboxy-5-ureidoimidazoline decarboxylase [Chytridium lagenaria]|nr:Oxo-4-hydroxy-4-carboxy-5-ureidoimidazoline decarboxylase [Chytridium lagenaria]